MSEIWTGLLLAFRIVFAGGLWLPVQPDGEGGSRVSAYIAKTGRVVTLGLLLNFLPALLLAPAGLWSPRADWLAWVLLLVLGVLRQVGRHSLCIRVKTLMGVFAGIVLTISVVLYFPPRSEWLAGGWDPGIYQNNAVAIATRDGLKPAENTIYSVMTEAEMDLCSRSAGEYREVMPGVPVRLRDGGLPLFFFHLTPICGAWFYRTGGLELLNRMPGAVAMLGLWPVCALFGMLGLRGWRQGLAVLFWAVSPMWWYQQAIPTSEQLYILLMCGGILFYLQAVLEKKTLPVAAGFCAFAATVNHFNFLVVGSILLLVAAGAEAFNSRPGRFSRVSFCIAAMLLGAMWDICFSWITIYKLHEKDAVLWLVLGPFAAISAASLMLGWRPVPERLQIIITRAVGLSVAVGAGCVVVMAPILSFSPLRDLCFRAADRLPVIGDMLPRFYHLMAFNGVFVFLLLGVGMLFWCRDKSSSSGMLRTAIFGFGLVTVLFLVSGGVASIYPWALRRYMIVAVPCIVLVHAYACSQFAEKWKGLNTGIRLAGCILAGLAIAGGAVKSVSACRVGDYKGLSAILDKLDAPLRSGDVIVSDDPRWGTPLLLARGRDVLNGKLLWSSKDPQFAEDFLRMLKRLQEEDRRRILWLTSTDQQLGIYPVDVGTVTPVFEGFKFVFRTVVHSPRGKGFETKENSKTFVLYEWQSEAVAHFSAFSRSKTGDN